MIRRPHSPSVFTGAPNSKRARMTREEKMTTFSEITKANNEVAVHVLEALGWNLDGAVISFLEQQQESRLTIGGSFSGISASNFSFEGSSFEVAPTASRESPATSTSRKPSYFPVTSRFSIVQAIKDGNLALLRTIIRDLPLAYSHTSSWLTAHDLDFFNFTPLIYAAFYGRAEIMEFLLDQDDSKVSVELTAADGRTALHNAVLSGSLRCLQLLLNSQTKARIDRIDNDGHSALHLAAYYGRPECLLLLLHKGIDRNVKDKQGFTALMWAASSGQAKCLHLLLLDKSVSDRENQKSTALILAAQKGNASCICTILEDGMHPDYQPDSDGCTALHWAVRNGNEDCVNFLLLKQADPLLEDFSSKSALYYAENGSNCSIISILLESLTEQQLLMQPSTIDLLISQMPPHECPKKALQKRFGNLRLFEFSEITIDLKKKNLYGPMPQVICDMTKLTYLNLSDNKITGSLHTIWKMASLETLNLSNNLLTGPLPDTLWNLTTLIELNLSKNRLTGSISYHLYNLTRVRKVDLSFNKLNGPVPKGLRKMTNLSDLNLRGNFNLWLICCEDFDTTAAFDNQARPVPIPPISLEQTFSYDDYITGMRTKGYAIHEVAGDGHCLYNAVCHQLGGGSHTALRSAVADYIVNNWEDLKNFTTDSMECIVSGIRDSTWADHLEIYVIEKICGCQAQIFKAENADLMPFKLDFGNTQEEMTEQTKMSQNHYIRLSYRNNNHYDSVVPINTQQQIQEHTSVNSAGGQPDVHSNLSDDEQFKLAIDLSMQTRPQSPSLGVISSLDCPDHHGLNQPHPSDASQYHCNLCQRQGLKRGPNSLTCYFCNFDVCPACIFTAAQSFGVVVRVGKGLQNRDHPLSPGCELKAGNSVLVVESIDDSSGNQTMWITITEGPLKGERRSIQKTGATLGRLPECTIQISDDLGISRNHAEIIYDRHVQRFYVCDMGSSNGTYIHFKQPTVVEQTCAWLIDSQSIAIRDSDLIGQGRFGKVYKGKWMGTRVAVKMLLNQEQDAATLKAFTNEISIFLKLRHPNIAHFLGACLTPGIAIVMDFYSFGTLEHALQRQPPPARMTEQPFYTPEDAWPWMLIEKIAYEIACGMGYLHSCAPPILHRNLKSANVLLGNCFSVKLTDFGLAKTKGNSGSHALDYGGSICWIAPEILEHREYEERADVYSYAVVCWELLCRMPPYRGMMPAEVETHVTLKQQRLELPNWCPTHFRDMISYSWKHAPEDRPTFKHILDPNVMPWNYKA